MNVILLIDMPTTCEDCPCYDQEVGTCRASNSWKTNIRNNCPLKSLPEKKKHEEEIDYDYGYIDGWNDCLEELEK